MRKYTVKPTKGVWIKFPEDDETEVLVKPMSVFALNKLPSDDNISFQQAWDIFNTMVADWKGIVDEDGNPIKCTEETKKMVYEFDQELVAFIMEESNKLRDQVVGGKKELKNSKTSQRGEVTQQEK